MSRRAAAALVALALAGSACIGGSGEPVPDVVNRYLTALQEGRTADAFALTDLDSYELAPGFALSEAHFAAFYRANPLLRSSVVDVFRQTITERLDQEGSPFWTVDLDLVYDFGTSRQSVYVEGGIASLRKVQIEPVAIPLAVPDGTAPSVLVDGVATPVVITDGRTSVTVFAGEHDLTFGGLTIRVLTTPLTVVSGPARVVEDPVPTVELTG